MQKKFLETMEEIMDLDEGELAMDSVFEDYDEWDSLSALGLTLFAKNQLEKILTVDTLNTFETVADIYHFCYGE